MGELALPFDSAFGERYSFPVEPDLGQIAALVRELVAKERPEAIIARNDDVAAIVLKTLLEMGVRCPDDIAVAGFDNKPFAQYLHPGLTTVDTKLPLASNAAVETLIRLIEGKAPAGAPAHLTIEPELTVRESA
jgi:DNA-binding LacI/PurR family transcriptional regulator